MDQAQRIVATGFAWVAMCSAVFSDVLPFGVIDDEQTSIVYMPDTGEIAVDAPIGTVLQSIVIDSAANILSFCDPPDLPGFQFPCTISRDSFGGFGSVSFGDLAQTGLSGEFMLHDLTVTGQLFDGGGVGPVDLVYMHDIFAGDANRDFTFDQLDLVKVQQASEYLTGQAATWGEGDWNGAPGGYPGEPPVGDGVFDQKDIVAALQAGAYLRGSYAAISEGGAPGNEQASIYYDVTTGDFGWDAPQGREFTSLLNNSESGIFGSGTDDVVFGPDCGFAGLSFPECLEGGPHGFFRAVFGESFGSQNFSDFGISLLASGLSESFLQNDLTVTGSLTGGGDSFGDISFGNVLPAGLTEETVAADLTAIGSLNGNGDLGDVDLVYIPEPSSFVLHILGVVALSIRRVTRSNEQSPCNGN